MKFPCISVEKIIYKAMQYFLTALFFLIFPGNLLNSSCNASTSLPEKPSCSKISDNYCDELYSKENRGNLIRGNSRFYLGKTKKGALKARMKLDWEALFAASRRLPADLRKVLAEPLKQIKKLLQKEVDTEEWADQHYIARIRLRDAIRKFTREKTEKRLPQLKKTSKSDLTVLMISEYQKDYYDTKNLILEAKYARHPAWQRVQRIFKEVQRDLVQILRELPFEKSIGNWMVSRVRTVQLKLPYQDNRIFESATKTYCGSHGLRMRYSRKLWMTLRHPSGFDLS